MSFCLKTQNMLPVPGHSHSRKPSYTRSPETLHFSLVGSFSNGVGEKCALNFLQQFISSDNAPFWDWNMPPSCALPMPGFSSFLGSPRQLRVRFTQ